MYEGKSDLYSGVNSSNVSSSSDRSHNPSHNEINKDMFKLNFDNSVALVKITAKNFSNVMPLEKRCFSTAFFFSLF